MVKAFEESKAPCISHGALIMKGDYKMENQIMMQHTDEKFFASMDEVLEAYHEKCKTIATLEGELKSYRRRAGGYKAQMVRYQNETKDTFAEATTLRNKIMQMEKEIAKLRDTNAILNMCTKERRDLTEERDRLRNEVATMKNEMVALKARLFDYIS